MQGLNLLLTKWINSFFEFVKEDPVTEITSLHYDKSNNKLVIGVNGGFWVVSEDSKGVRGLFYGE